MDERKEKITQGEDHARRRSMGSTAEDLQLLGTISSVAGIAPDLLT
ncbi:hypothetical protein [Rhodococcus opacus]|nr:hypothetical protein [Rhodococcus opacus]